MVRDETPGWYSQTLLQQFLARNHVAAVIHQIAQKLQFLAGQVDRHACLAHLAAVEIHLDDAEAEAQDARQLLLLDAAQQRFDPASSPAARRAW